jgi:hypothetical protein
MHVYSGANRFVEALWKVELLRYRTVCASSGPNTEIPSVR